MKESSLSVAANRRYDYDTTTTNNHHQQPSQQSQQHPMVQLFHRTIVQPLLVFQTNNQNHNHDDHTKSSSSSSSSTSSSCTSTTTTNRNNNHNNHILLQCRGGSSSTILVEHHHDIIQHIPLNVWKVIFQSLLSLLNIVCWYVPLRQMQKTKQKLQQNHNTIHHPSSSSQHTISNQQSQPHSVLLSYANIFSSGIFLSLAFTHFIPECIHGYTSIKMQQQSSLASASHSHHLESIHLNHIIVPCLYVLFGYLLIFFIEHIAFDAHDLIHQHHHNEHEHDTIITTSELQPHLHSNGIVNPTTITTTDVKDVATLKSTNHGHHQHHHQNSSNNIITSRSALILLGALSVHSILEMMALGLSDTFSDCAILSLSISLHQPAESIALLVAFLKSNLSQSQIILFLSIFTCMGPIGVLLGMMVNSYAPPIVDMIMIAIVAGTFIYVGATEIIPEEFDHTTTDKWKKFITLLSGIITIIGVTQYTASLGGHHH